MVERDLDANEWASVDEIGSAILELTDADHLRLRRIADAMMRSHHHVEGEDLLQEAFTRLLEPGEEGTPTRHWKRGTRFLTCVVGVMRSLADEYRRQQKAKQAMEAGTVEDTGVTSPDSPENRDARILASKRVAEIYQFFHEDELVEEILLRLHEEMTAEEIQADLELSPTEYATARRRLRRQLDKKYPQGWRK